MNVLIEQVTGNVPVTILSTTGDLDASNYMDLINTAKEVYRTGARFILLDMSETPFMSSAGLMALHSIVLLARGQKPVNPELGWEAFKTIDRDRENGTQRTIKLLNPQPKVDRTLEMSGMKRFFEIYTDRQTALSAYA